MKLLWILLISTTAFANPYPDHTKVPYDTDYPAYQQAVLLNQLQPPQILEVPSEGLEVLRITLDWNAKTESYTITRKVIEPSGTQALVNRSRKPPQWGSYRGQINTGKETFYDSIGTGALYRKLTRAITFRFPLPQNDFQFDMQAENPTTGKMEKVVSTAIKLKDLEKDLSQLPFVEGRKIRAAQKTPSLVVAIYADGYSYDRKEAFYEAAQRTVLAFESTDFPEQERMEFVAVFAPSIRKLDSAVELGLPVADYDTFTGLYFPYWEKFGRWDYVAYPTRDDKFRKAMATTAYDYNIILADSARYWGVGNFKSHTAVPANSEHFVFLLLHEFGHYLGLNEEYESGGRTELEFAPQMEEPWSQNMTFLRTPTLGTLKWAQFVTNKSTLIPTPESFWQQGRYGAYRGGYAGSPVTGGHNHKPGFQCVMETFGEFCAICVQGLKDVINHDSQ